MAIGDTGTFTDPRDGQVYPWKIMKDGKKWMTKNLNFKSPDSYCYDRNEANGAKYGRLYNYKDAKAAIPAGWRMPKPYEDWDPLLNAYGIDGRGLDIFKRIGFGLVFSGYYYEPSKKFIDLGEIAGYWTFDEVSQQGGEPWPWAQLILNPIQKSTNSWKSGFSVRCVMDV